MITITPDWAIEKDYYCLVLKHRSFLSEKSATPGEEVWKTEGYYGNLTQLVKGMVDIELFSESMGEGFTVTYFKSLQRIINMVELACQEHAQATISEKEGLGTGCAPKTA